VTRTENGVRRVLLREALDTMRAIKQAGWPFKGPAAVKDVLAGIVASGLEPPAYHNHWKQASGVSPRGGVCSEHAVLITVIWMMCCYDQYDALNSAAAEQICRRILMLQRAVKRNPRNPDFENLECFMSNSLDAAGGVTTLEFDEYIATLQKTEAQIMKQQRLAREESEHADKHKKGAGGGGQSSGGGGGGGKKTKQKDGGPEAASGG